MDDEYRDIVLKVYRETPHKTKPGCGFGLWLIQKVKNGVSFNVQVRAGWYSTDAVTGLKKYPKDGLGKYDFKAISAVYKSEVEPTFNNPPPVADPLTPPPPAPPEEEISDCPF